MGDRSFAAGRFGFGIDGNFAGYLKKVSGGTIKGEVVTHNLATTNLQRKHLATISHEPLTCSIAMGMGADMWEWIKASFDRGFVQKNCELLAADFNHKVKAVRVFNDAYIKKLTIPACDGSSKEPGYFDLEIDPVTIRYEKGTGADLPGEENPNAKKWLCSNWRFEMDGPVKDACSKIAKIDAQSWEQKVVKDELGSFREPDKLPASLVVPNLKLTISMADIQPWADWHRSFVIDGKCTDADETTASLTLLGPDLQEELMVITYDHVGIISLEQAAVEANKEEIARFTVELYAESMRIDTFNT